VQPVPNIGGLLFGRFRLEVLFTQFRISTHTLDVPTRKTVLINKDAMSKEQWILKETIDVLAASKTVVTRQLELEPDRLIQAMLRGRLLQINIMQEYIPNVDKLYDQLYGEKPE
jgi:hypothetical protein